MKNLIIALLMLFTFVSCTALLYQNGVKEHTVANYETYQPDSSSPAFFLCMGSFVFTATAFGYLVKNSPTFSKIVTAILLLIIGVYLIRAVGSFFKNKGP